MTDAVSLFKCLGDETRFRIVCCLYRSDSYVELLAETLGLTPGTVSFHLKKMEDIGLVRCSRTQYYIIYSLNREILSKTPESFIAEACASGAENTVQKEEAYRRRVIASFIRGGRLLQIPVQQKKRAIILSALIKDLTVGAQYPEKEINALLGAYYPDYCTLRRWLIEDGFMTREHEIYTVLRK